MPGRSSPAKATPRSTAIHCRRRSSPKPVEREIHADLADAAERREDEFIGGARPWPCPDQLALSADDAGAMNTSPAAMVWRCRRQAQHQAAGLVERLETAGEFAIGEAHAHVFAEPGGAREPVGADGGKALAAVPLRQARRASWPTSALNSACGRDRGAGGGEIGRGIIGIRRMARAIDADADRRRRAARRPRLRSGCRRTLSPSSSRSFGHLSASRGSRSGATSTTASCSASAATNESCGQRSGGAGSVSSRLA